MKEGSKMHTVVKEAVRNKGLMWWSILKILAFPISPLLQHSSVSLLLVLYIITSQTSFKICTLLLLFPRHCTNVCKILLHCLMPQKSNYLLIANMEPFLRTIFVLKSNHLFSLQGQLTYRWISGTFRCPLASWLSWADSFKKEPGI